MCSLQRVRFIRERLCNVRGREERSHRPQLTKPKAAYLDHRSAVGRVAVARQSSRMNNDARLWADGEKRGGGRRPVRSRCLADAVPRRAKGPSKSPISRPKHIMRNPLSDNIHSASHPWVAYTDTTIWTMDARSARASEHGQTNARSKE